jgi:hypothetical protein
MRSKTSTNQHNPAKRTRNRVPPPQRERILQKYVNGKSIRDISKEEQRNRETVSKIVHGPEMQEHVRAMRERWFGLAPDAISAVEHGLTEQKDGRLGFQLLASIGVIPSPQERQLLAAEQAAAGMSVMDYRERIGKGLMYGALHKAAYYEAPLREMDEQLKKAGAKFNYETCKFERLEEKATTSEMGETRKR